MKKDIHPKDFRDVIFLDNSSGAMFLMKSTIKTNEKGNYTDGKEYPVYHVEISSASHPFYTNQEKSLDAAGRVEKFKNRAAASKAKPKVKKAA